MKKQSTAKIRPNSRRAMNYSIARRERERHQKQRKFFKKENKIMKKLSTGADSTLRNWRALTAVTFGEDSAATEFLDERIKKEGENSEVIADERQFLQVIAHRHFEGKTKN